MSNSTSSFVTRTKRIDASHENSQRPIKLAHLEAIATAPITGDTPGPLGRGGRPASPGNRERWLHVLVLLDARAERPSRDDGRWTIVDRPAHRRSSIVDHREPGLTMCSAAIDHAVS
jgi:hypothetical protein